MNADAIAKHFYEQGMADATKDRVVRDKNIDLNPRQTHGETNVDGIKVRVLGQSSSDIKNRSFKIRKKCSFCLRQDFVIACESIPLSSSCQ